MSPPKCETSMDNAGFIELIKLMWFMKQVKFQRFKFPSKRIGTAPETNSFPSIHQNDIKPDLDPFG